MAAEVAEKGEEGMESTGSRVTGGARWELRLRQRRPRGRRACRRRVKATVVAVKGTRGSSEYAAARSPGRSISEFAGCTVLKYRRRGIVGDGCCGKGDIGIETKGVEG